MKTDNILKLEVDNKTKHLEKYLRSQWTWKTYVFILSLLAALIFVVIDLEINFIKLFYTPKNSPLTPSLAGNPNITYPNNWQPLSLTIFIDQSGNEIPQNTPDFLSPEWGNVKSFALTDSNLTTHVKDRIPIKYFMTQDFLFC